MSNPVDFVDLKLINLLSTLSIVIFFNELLRFNFEKFIEIVDIIPSAQSGFRAVFSYETALLSITDDILAATDRGLITI